MNEKTFKQWWQLHLRVATGEALGLQEQTQYETGLDALDKEEREQFQAARLNQLRQLRAQIEQLQNLN